MPKLPFFNNAGIRAKLLMAFGAVSLTTAIAGGVTWYSYSYLSSVIGDITETSVPRMTAAYRLALAGRRLEAILPRFAQASDEGQRIEYRNDLTSLALHIDALMAELAKKGVDKEQLGHVQSSIQSLKGGLDKFNESVQQRLSVKSLMLKKVEEIASAHVAVETALSGLIDEASFNLVTSSDDITTQLTSSLKAVVEGPVVMMRQVLKMQAEANALISILAQAIAAQSPDMRIVLEAKFDAATWSTRSTLETLDKSDREGEIGKTLEAILALGSGDKGIFKSPGSRAQRIEELLKLQEAFQPLFDPVVNVSVLDVKIKSDQLGQNTEKALTKLVKEDVNRLRYLLELQANANLLLGIMSQAAQVPDMEQLAPLQKHFVQTAFKLAAAAENIPSDGSVVRLIEIVNAMKALGEGDDSIFRLKEQELGRVIAAGEVANEKAMEITLLIGAIEAIVEETRAAVTGRANDAGTAIAAGQSLITIIVLASLAFSALIAWFYVGRSLVPRITSMGDVMRELSSGNMNVEVAVGGTDEIADMAKAVQVFKDNMAENERLQREGRDAEQASVEAERRREDEQREAEARARDERKREMVDLANGFEESVGSIIETVNGAVAEMEKLAQSMAGYAGETSQQSTAVAAASEEATANVQAVAAAADQLSQAVQEIAQRVSSSATIADRAVRDAAETNEKVQGLSEAAQKIGDVVSLINDIAGQTNLLALNATIEAARAGEAGKGFAVVATEVKSLADQTAKATDEISSQISAIQAATAVAVEAIGGIGGTIAEINEIASAISSAVEEQEASTQEIAGNVRQAAAGTQDVTSNIANVTRAADETGNAAQQVLDGTRELAQQADMLRASVDQFLDKVRAA